MAHLSKKITVINLDLHGDRPFQDPAPGLLWVYYRVIMTDFKFEGKSKK